MTFPLGGSPFSPRAVRASLLLLCGLAPLAAAPKAAGPVVTLPKYVVTDSRVLPPPESWRYATIPGFEILSSASDRATQRLMQDFEMFREALNVVWPIPTQLNTPVLLILCDHAGKFQSFLPAKTDGGPSMARASVFLDGKLRSAIVIDVGTTVININSPDAADPASGEDPTQFSVEDNKQLYREYVHYLLSRAKPRLPAWFEEGMAQIIMAMQFTPKWIEFGHIHDANTVSAQAGMAASLNAMAAASSDSTDSDMNPDQSTDIMGAEPVDDKDFNAALAHRALMPMKELFAVKHDSPEALNPLGNNTWAKQCYAFVHMGLFGEREQWQKPFTEFLIRSTREPVTEQMFKDCFHMSYSAMGIQLRGYVEGPDYTSRIYKAKDGRPFLDSKPLVLRDATPAEIGRIKGEAMELAGNSAGARLELIAPYIRGESDPDLLAALGEFEHTSGNDVRSQKFLEAAVTGKTRDAEAYLELARLRIAEADAKPAGPAGRYSAAQVSAITTLLLDARRLPPPMPETYELLAQTLARSPVQPTKPEIAPLIEGVRLFSNRLRLVYLTAAVCANAGLNDTASSLVDYGMKNAPTASGREEFARLKQSLPPEPAAARPAANKG